jgi:hypothetical protein
VLNDNGFAIRSAHYRVADNRRGAALLKRTYQDWLDSARSNASGGQDPVGARSEFSQRMQRFLAPAAKLLKSLSNLIAPRAAVDSVDTCRPDYVVGRNGNVVGNSSFLEDPACSSAFEEIVKAGLTKGQVDAALSLTLPVKL